MSSPKTFKRYSTFWIDTFLEMQHAPEAEYVIECNSEEHARLLRLEFYKVRTAFMKEPKWEAELGYLLDSREVRVRGTKVIFMHKDKNWVANALQEALERKGAESEP